MTLNAPSISKEIKSKDIKNLLNLNHSAIQPGFINFHAEWLTNGYGRFKDHDKNIIIIYLVNKTMKFYNRNLIVKSFDEYYLKKNMEIDKINILKLSKDLKIPKETARRKIYQLQKIGVITKIKKKIILDRLTFTNNKPSKSIKNLSKVLSIITDHLSSKNNLNLRLSGDEIEKIIKKNFTYCWHHFFEFQINYILSGKKIFQEIDILHIWLIVYLNKIINLQKIGSKFNNKDDYNFALIGSDKSLRTPGINAMSISDVTGIPRPTVIRKLNILLNKKYLNIDKRKLYHINNANYKKLSKQQEINLDKFSALVTKILNLKIFN